MVPAMKINDMAKMAYENSRAHGFWDGVAPGDIDVIPLKIALIHSEASEALEAYREQPADGLPLAESTYLPSGKPVGFASELADIIIRVGDLAEHLGIDLERAIIEKHLYNVSRPRLHRKLA